MNKAMLFKFGKWIDYGKSHPRGKKFPLPKGHSLGPVIVLWMKPHSLNFANASNMVRAFLGLKNCFPEMGVVSVT